MTMMLQLMNMILYIHLYVLLHNFRLFFYLHVIFISLIGLLRQPKWGHLKDLHHAVKQCEHALVAAGDPVVTSLGHNL
jgi:hypothetical protein